MDRSLFTKQLMIWGAEVQRPMPWKGEKDPYRIWLSEVILQQTRVAQGLAYYERFIELFPNVDALAKAPLDTVLKAWEGLGYYSRARNLHASACYVSDLLGGKFPDTYEEILKLKGVGAYTAAAIASFAYKLPYAVLDGNVYRVLARYFGIETPIGSAEGKKIFEALAAGVLEHAAPDLYNQAIMDFGAIQCTPQQPKCHACPLAATCAAFQSNRVGAFPNKAKKMAKRDRNFLYAVVFCDHDVLIRQRIGRDIWRHLYEFPMLEITDSAPLSEEKIQAYTQQLLAGFPGQYRITEVSGPFVQLLTHQKITAFFAVINLERRDKTAVLNSNLALNCIFVDQIKFKKIYALPRIIDQYWQKKVLSLSWK